MTDSTTRRLTPPAAARLALGALVLGIVGDALLRGTPWGMNIVVWGALVGGAALLTLGRVSSTALLALGLGEACLATLAWRDTPFLQVWNVLALLAALSLITAYTARGALADLPIRDGILAAVESAVRAASQAGVLLSRDLSWSGVRASKHWRRAPAAAGGIMLAIPIVVVFGSLLRSADPQFTSLTDRLLWWNFPKVASHVMLVAAIAWITAGYLRATTVRQSWLLEPPTVSAGPQLGLLQVAIPLGALALMFLLFAGMQAEYLFGGPLVLLHTTGLTVAEYARKGFFELVAVAALVLGLLLALHAAIDRSDQTTLSVYRALAALLVALVSALMASALVRMRLYVGYFGLSEERIYATAFMLWVGAVLAWFVMTVLRAQASRFAYGAVIAGFATLLVLSAINPQAMIVRTNIARAAVGTPLDVKYLNHLSGDAVPPIVAAWPALDAEARCQLWQGVLQPWREPATTDWRSWNLARARARQAVRTLEPPC